MTQRSTAARRGSVLVALMVAAPLRVDLAKPLILRDAGLVCEREDQIEAWIAMIMGSGRGFGSSEDCVTVGREVPVTLLERKPLAGSHAYRIRIHLPSGRQVVGWTHIGSLRT